MSRLKLVLVIYFCFMFLFLSISFFTTSTFGQGVYEAWVARYNGPGNNFDYALALAVDDSGNVYVTGYSGVYPYEDYATIKYSPFGETLWVKRYDGPGNGRDEAVALAVDDSGNVYVTGFSKGSGTSGDYATIKYSYAGDTLWVRRYNGPGNDNDGAVALAVDGSGNVYVTGYSWSGTTFDYATIKYSYAGDTLWVRSYNGPGNEYDEASALAVDDSGNVYVTGSSVGSDPYNYTDYATIKYSSSGDTLWVKRYNGAGNGGDGANALAVDDSGNVYVTGWSLGTVWPDNDYATIKYFPCTSANPKTGDANGDGEVNLADIIFKIDYIFKAGPKPNPSCRADVNADGNLLLTDIVYLINFLFKSGSTPQPTGTCCLYNKKGWRQAP